jgi:hypothetical protein
MQGFEARIAEEGESVRIDLSTEDSPSYVNLVC